MPNKDNSKVVEDIAKDLVEEAKGEISNAGVQDELGYREFLDGYGSTIDEGISSNYGELPAEEYDTLWLQIFDKALGMLMDVKTADQNLDNDDQDMGPGRFDYQTKVKPEDLAKKSEDGVVPMPVMQRDPQDLSGREQFPGQSTDFTNPREGDTKYTYSNESPKEGRKKYNITYGVGEAKYVVSYHDGVKKHNDGSDFYDVAIFKNKKDLEQFEQDLLKKGYVYGSALSTDAKYTYSSLTSIVQSMENAIAGGNARIPYTKREGNWAYTLDKDYILHITYFATEVITADFNEKKVLSVTAGGYGSVSTKSGITRRLSELRDLGYSVPELKDYETEIKSTLKVESAYPRKYFKNPEYAEKAESFGLMDMENEDLTPEGLIAKMYEWQETDHEVDPYIYDLTKKELGAAGYKMPADIIRSEASLKKKSDGDIDFNQVANDIPDSDVPSETSIFIPIGNKVVYVEGWNDNCYGNVLGEIGDTRESKVEYAKQATPELVRKQPYLPQNKNLEGYQQVDARFIETPNKNLIYGVSIGVYEKILKGSVTKWIK